MPAGEMATTEDITITITIMEITFGSGAEMDGPLVQDRRSCVMVPRCLCIGIPST